MRVELVPTVEVPHPTIPGVTITVNASDAAQYEQKAPEVDAEAEEEAKAESQSRSRKGR